MAGRSSMAGRARSAKRWPAAPGHDAEERDHAVLACRPELRVVRAPALPSPAPALEPGKEAVMTAIDAGVGDVEVADLGVRVQRLEGGGPVLLHRGHEPAPDHLDVVIRGHRLSIPLPTYPRWAWPPRHQTASQSSAGRSRTR